MNECGLEISLYRAGYVCAANIFKQKRQTDERTVCCYELVIFLSDGGYFFVNNKKYMITSGSCRLFRAGDRVSSYKFNDVYSIHFMINQNGNDKDILENIPTFFTLPDLNEAIKITEELCLCLRENNKLDSICKLCELLSYIKENTTTGNQKKPAIASVKKYIDANFSENITLNTLSEIFYLHPVYLQRKFKQEYGLSPTDYIINVRINHAKNYLISTNMTTEEISSKVGFSYPSYFIKVFKRIVQNTPLQYRKLMLSNN